MKNIEKTTTFSMSAKCCPERSRRVPDCSKSTQDASRMAPRAPKTPPEWLQEHPRRLPDGSKSACDASRTAPRAPELSPQCFKKASGHFQDDSNMPKKLPKSLLDIWTGLQEASVSIQNTPKMRPQRPPSALGGSLQHKVRPRACSQDWPVDKACPSLRPAPPTSLCSFCAVD